MANEPLAGKRFVDVTEKKTKREWAYFVKDIADNHYPNAVKIRLVMDNYSKAWQLAEYGRNRAERIDESVSEPTNRQYGYYKK